MFCRKTPLGLRKQARKRSGTCSRPGNKLVPVVSPDKVDDDADSKLVSSSRAPSRSALKKGNSDRSALKKGNSDVITDSGHQGAPLSDGDTIPLKMKRSLKKGNSDIVPDSGHQGAPLSDGDTIPLKKKRSFTEVLRTRSRSLTRSLSWKKNKESSDVYEFVDSQPIERRPRSRSRSLSVSTIHSLKQDTLLAISNEQVTPITEHMETPKSTPSDATTRPGKQKRNLKDRLLLTRPRSLSRPRSITEESDFQLISTPTPESPHRSFGPPRITINEDFQDVVNDALLVQSRNVKSLASPHKPRGVSSSSSDEDATSRYAIPDSYILSTEKPATRRTSDSHKPRAEYVLEERHWGSKLVRRIRSHQSDARSHSQASESTWIPTEDERYKMASAFIFGEDNLSVGSTSMFTDETGFTGTSDVDTASIVSETTGTATGVLSVFTDDTDDTGNTTKTNDTGYATCDGDTSDCSDMHPSSYTDGTSFVSSRTTEVTDEMSMFDLALNDSKCDTPVEKLENGTPVERKDIRRREGYQYRRPKKSKNVFLEVIADLQELRIFAMTSCLPCHGH